MTILLTLEIEGGNLGPFNLYSNTDGYTNQFATNITKAALEAGYTSTSVPPNTTTVQVKSVGNCSNTINVVLENTTSTTTSTTTSVPGVPCNGTSDSGGAGLKDLNVNLDPTGGVITFLFDPQQAADKMEFYHGVPQDDGINKVATTSQSAPGEFGGNYGPFDDDYGTPPTIIFPNNPVTDVDQFIGTLKGTVPTRQSQYTSDTGCTIPDMTIGSITYDQVIWWKYDAADYLANPVVTVRITGSGDNTLWNSIRICNVCTTTTTTSSSSTSTSTSTSTTTTTTTTTYVCPDCVQGADILIGTQLWTRCNLDVDTYRDLTPIPQAVTDVDWYSYSTNKIGAWCYFDNNSANGAIYGKLYNLYAVMGIWNEASLLDPLLRKEFAPIGYHVPSVEETDVLINYLGGASVAGGNLRTTGTIEGNDGCWLSPNTGATNSSGFRALPGGFRVSFGNFEAGNYGGSWWDSLGEQSIDGVQLAGLTLFNNTTYAGNAYYRTAGDGNSVRLIKD